MTRNLRYTWAVEDIYVDVKEWEKDFSLAESLIDFSAYKGKLGDEKAFADCMSAIRKVSRIFGKLSVYAMMLKDSDTGNSEYDALSFKVQNLGVKFYSATAFVTPELTALDESVLMRYIKDEKLADYDYMLKCILKRKAHVLSENEEKLLAESAEETACFKDIFTKIDNADLPLGKVKHGGKVYELSHGTYGMLMQNGDRVLRKKVFRKYYSAYGSLLNTITATYKGSVLKDVFYAKAGKYESALAAALSEEDVSVDVYKNLIESVHGALPLLHEYIAEKKKLLGVKSMHMYDMYVPTTADADLKMEYDDAYALVVKGLSCLGDEYCKLLRKAHDERWIDVYEKKAKRSGAYSVAVYDTHPFVLLNYTKTTHDVFTIAHEMGHSIHSYFSNKNQPYEKADYKIFVAEVASTVNEVLLVKYLLKEATDKNLKKYLLFYLLEMIRTTLFRQTQFAEFEEYSHACAENGTPITKDSLCAEYLRLNKEYYGDAVVSDDEIATEWARIPHFYRAFYVYKYATGIISALAIADKILREGDKAVKGYFEFLSAGDSDSPVELLKIAGVDLTDKKTFDAAFRVFKDTLEEYKKI